MSHNETCILSGPEGGWEVDSYSQDGDTSFTYGCNSLYLVHHQNYTDIFSWLLYYKNSKFQDMSFDFLVHPATGCNFADHYEFSMSVGEYIPNNNYGIASEGGWEDEENASGECILNYEIITTHITPRAARRVPHAACRTHAPRARTHAQLPHLNRSLGSHPVPLDPTELDRFGLAYLKANVDNVPDVESCNLATSEFNLHVLYDPSSDLATGAKDSLVADIAAAGLGDSVEFIVDDTSSWATTGSPFYVAQVQYAVSADALTTLLPLVSQRTAGDATHIDLVLAPNTGCPVYDYFSFSMAVGRTWPVNLAALAVAQSQEATARTFPLPRSASFAKIVETEADAREAAAHVPSLAAGCDSSPEGYVLYALSASNNAYAVAALETFLSDMSSSLELTREECTDLYPAVEPAYEKLCMMQEVATPYKVFEDVMTTNYGALYVPTEELATVMAYAMTHRGPVQSGYIVDLKLVPLTGCAAEDHSQFAFVSGTNWRVNASPFEDESVKARRPHRINANRQQV